MTPTQLALAWLHQRSYAHVTYTIMVTRVDTNTIVGATSAEKLKVI